MFEGGNSRGLFEVMGDRNVKSNEATAVKFDDAIVFNGTAITKSLAFTDYGFNDSLGSEKSLETADNA